MHRWVGDGVDAGMKMQELHVDRRCYGTGDRVGAGGAVVRRRPDRDAPAILSTLLDTSGDAGALARTTFGTRNIGVFCN